MIFDIVPNFFASLISILLPVFASYKALRTADPAQLSPWLMYWVAFGLVTLVETQFALLLFFVPFYSTMRLFVLLYLVLPQTQGARLVYQSYIHPFLATHEARIEQGISDAHIKLKSLGLDYLRDFIAWVQKSILGYEPQPSRPATYPGPESYVSSLLARFNLPSARDGLAAPAADFYGLLSAAAATIGRGVAASGPGGAAARDAQIEELSRSGTLIPSHIKDPKDRASFLSQQREKLRVLLGALDKEATELEAEGSGTTHARTEHRVDPVSKVKASGAEITRTKSETGFERIDPDEASPAAPKDASSGGWLGWALGGGNGHHGKGEKEEKSGRGDEAKGASSGVDARS